MLIPITGNSNFSAEFDSLKPKKSAILNKLIGFLKCKMKICLVLVMMVIIVPMVSFGQWLNSVTYDENTATVKISVTTFIYNYSSRNSGLTKGSGSLDAGKLSYTVDGQNWVEFYEVTRPGWGSGNTGVLNGVNASNTGNADVTLNISNLTIGIKKIRLLGHVNIDNGFNDEDISPAVDITIPQISSFNTPSTEFLLNNITRISYTKSNASGAGIDAHSEIRLLSKDFAVIATNPFSQTGFFDIPTPNSANETNYYIQQSAFQSRITLNSGVATVGAFTQPTSISATYDDNAQLVTLQWSINKVTTNNLYTSGFKIQQANNATFSNATNLQSPDYDKTSNSYSIILNNNLSPNMYFRVVRDNGTPNWALGTATGLIKLNIDSINANQISLVLQSDNTALITWNSMQKVWLPGASFVITRKNLTTKIYTPIVLSKDDFLLGRYVDEQIALCNEYTYTLQILPPQGSNFLPRPPAAIVNIPLTIRPIDIGTIMNLTVSKGYFPDRTELTWSSKGIFDNFIVKRAVYGTNNFVQLASVAGSSSSDYQTDDIKGTPGVYYTYSVVGVIKCDNVNNYSKDILTAVGFRSPTGNIYGRVTYENGQAVENAAVRLQSIDAAPIGKSLYLDGSDTGYLKINSFNTNLSAEYTLEAWVKPANVITKNQVIFSQPNFYELGFNNNGGIYFKDSNNIVTATYQNPNLEYIHLAGIHTKDSLSLMVNDSVVSKVAALSRLPLPTSSDIYIGRNAAGNNFKGWVDEMRIWNTPKTPALLARDYTRLLTGGERGLVAYWRFDETIKHQFYDLSYFGDDYNQNDGSMDSNHVSRSSIIPTFNQLSLNGITDTTGNYMISGIPYTGNGTTYSIVPLLGTHQFDPSSVNRLISATSNSFTVDFKDKSSFPVEGTVFYKNTTIPVTGVQFKIDGHFAQLGNGSIIETDANGKFTLSVPVGSHEVKAFKNNHIFINDGKITNRFGNNLNYQGPVSQREILDSTTVHFIGRVAGGAIEDAYPLGHSLSTNNLGKVISIEMQLPSDTKYQMINGLDSTVIVKHFLPSNQKDSSKIHYSSTTFFKNSLKIYPDSLTGEFEADLIPEIFIAKQVAVTGWGNILDGKEISIDLTNKFTTTTSINNYTDSVLPSGKTTFIRTNYSDTVNYNSSYKFIKRVAPSVILVQKDNNNVEVPYFGDKIFKSMSFTGKLDTVKLIDNSKVGAEMYYYGNPVFSQTSQYNFVVKAFELYNFYQSEPLGNNSGILQVNGKDKITNVPTKDGFVSVFNKIKSGPVMADTFRLDTNGKGTYNFAAGEPDLAAKGFKTLDISIQFGPASTVSLPQLKVYVLGSKLTGTDFVTAGPDNLLMVLRDPPGSKSFSYAEKGTVITSSSAYSGSVDQVGDIDFATTLGVDLVTFTGAVAVVAITGVVQTVKATTGVTFGIHHEEHYTGSNTAENSVTLTTRFQTSDDAAFVGAPADVFVGYSSNITYGQSNNITIIRRAELKATDIFVYQPSAASLYILVQRGGINIGKTFGTMFAFPQTHIENVLIPNLIKIRNTALFPVGTLATDAQTQANSSHKQVYVSKIDAADEKFGRSNSDTSFGSPVAGATFDNGPSYRIYFPTSSLYRTDTILILNQYINNWKDRMKDNEEEKLKSTLLQNYSFHAGSPIEYSEQRSDKTIKEHAFNFIIAPYGGNSIDTKNIVAGFNYTFKESIGTSQGGVFSNSRENVKTIGFTLASNGTSDYFSVDVNTAKDNSFVFLTKGGVSGCPYAGEVKTKYYQPGTLLDQATQRIEVPKISVDKPVVSDIPSNRKASYTLLLRNESEAQLPGTFTLSYADNDTIKGATISIDGSPIGGGGRVVVVPYGETVQKVLTITKGPVSMNYKDIQIILRSSCEDAIADTVLVSAQFIPSCSEIHIKSPADKWIVNTKSSINTNNKRYLPITLDQFDVNTTYFDHIELQYKPSAVSSWITVTKFYADTAKLALAQGDKQLITNAQAINYNLIVDDASFNDQEYNIQAVSVCKLGEANYVTTESNIINGIKDTYNPRLFGSAQPANGVLGINDNVRLNFNETIAAGLLTYTDFQVTGIRNGIIGNHNVSVKLDGVGNYLQTEFAKNLSGKNTTTEMWIMTDTAVGGRRVNGTVFSQGNANESMELSFTADNYLQVIVGKKLIKSDKPVNYKQGEWAHVALVYNADSKKVSAFYNYVEYISGVSVDFYSGVGAYQLGRSISKAGDFFAGKMHRACIWSEALTITAIQINSLVQLSGAENNLLGYYAMDEGKGSICFDKAHGSHAALQGSWSTPAGKAIKFNGQGYVKLNTGTVPISSAMDYSMELWFKADPNQTDATLASNGKGDKTDAGSFSNFSLGFQNKLLTFENNGFKIQAEGNYLDNNWHHVAVAVNRTSGVAQLYADGILKSVFDAKNLGAIAADYIYLGTRAWHDTNFITDTHYDRYFKGSIDEFRLWNTYLNQTLIAKNNNSKLQGDEIGLLSYYPFETYFTFQNNKEMGYTLKDLKIQKVQTVNVPDAITINAFESDAMAPIKDIGPIENLMFDYVVNKDGLIINMLEPKQAIDKTIITFRTKNVKDLNGNEIISPITWSAYIDQNQLKWSDVSLNLSKAINAPMQFESYVVNNGGNIQNYRISNLPRWLTADVPSGTVPPLGKQKIIFTVNEALNVGTYDEVLFMRNDNNVAEALTLNMVVKGKQPVWTVNPAAFKYNMNVYGKLRINNMYSIDKDDVLAAFDNGKCVGVAKNAYNAQSDLWFAFLTVYNDSIQSSNIKFRIWQASTGKVFQATTSADVSFVSNSIVGSVRNPIIFDGKENVFQDISLTKGWNWISFNVLDKLTATNINETLSNGNWASGDVIKNELTGFSQYGNQSGWLGYLAGVNNTSLFTLKTNNTQSLSVAGKAVDVRVTPIPLFGNRWSYISYLPQVNLTLKDALAGYDAKNEDVIKSQSGFAMYDNVVGWVGNLTFLEPGKGYMVYRKAPNDTSFYYPAIKSLFKVAPLKNYISGLGINSTQIPVAANTGFSKNMTVTAKEGTGFVLQPNDLVIAYSAGEIRAKSHLIENAVLKNPTLFFNVSGEQDEAIYFQVERNGTVVAQSETVLTYGANTQVGTLSKPLLLNFTEASNSILVYPNPFAQKVMVNVKIAGNGNELHSVQLSIYNATGQSITILPEKQAKSGIFQSYWNGKTVNGVNCTPGIYFIHITIDGVTQVQKVIKN